MEGMGCGYMIGIYFMKYAGTLDNFPNESITIGNLNENVNQSTQEIVYIN